MTDSNLPPDGDAFKSDALTPASAGRNPPPPSYDDCCSRFQPFVLGRVSAFDNERFSDEVEEALEPFLRATVFLCCRLTASTADAHRAISEIVRPLIKRAAWKWSGRLRGVVFVEAPYVHPLDPELPFEEGMQKLLCELQAELDCFLEAKDSDASHRLVMTYALPIGQFIGALCRNSGPRIIRMIDNAVAAMQALITRLDGEGGGA